MRRVTTTFLTILLFLGAATGARADVLVLIHGYTGSSQSWEASGVVPALVADGWERTGIITLTPMGVQKIPGPAKGNGKSLYLVDLPSEAPLALQAYHLGMLLQCLRQHHPQEPVILVGHSVGGVVARLAVVLGRIPGISALVTIASPHLGTPLAERALDLTDDQGPMEMIKEFFGGDAYRYLQYSRSLHLDLARPRPGFVLYWLNLQPHPDIAYVSVIRGTPFALWGDALVPGPSQDMNQVPALQGRSAVVQAGLGHGLEPGDGITLLGILHTLESAKKGPPPAPEGRQPPT
ncbi:MAG: alpha/beta fold hydrolase [Magnetococcales bacterium]|nr:alpha/beta fold hydrolase [Magnetococcales bacterium]MBF0157642.1 alpha/beta fold hydrolase [Magnetococcales bacterium]